MSCPLVYKHSRASAQRQRKFFCAILLQSFLSRIDANNARSAVNGDVLAGGDALGGRGDADDGGDAVFAGDDGSVGYHAAHFHDEARGGGGEGGPARGGGGGYQDFSGVHASARRAEDESLLGRYSSGWRRGFLEPTWVGCNWAGSLARGA